MSKFQGDPEVDDLLPLKPVWLQLLLAMASGHCHGYAMRKDVARRTEGRVTIWPATLYRGLSGLMDAQLVEEDPAAPADNDDRERKLYRISPLGKQALAAEMHRLEALVHEARSLDIIPGGKGGLA